MKIEIYSKVGCSYCEKAKNHFKRENYAYTEHDLLQEGVKDQLVARLPAGYALKQVPQIFVDDKHIGGYMDTVEWLLANR